MGGVVICRGKNDNWNLLILKYMLQGLSKSGGKLDECLVGTNAGSVQKLDDTRLLIFYSLQ